MCGGDDPTIVWPSKLIVPGYAVAWSGAMTLKFDEPIVACAPHWRARSSRGQRAPFFVVQGNGPDNTGGGDGFSVPQRVTSDVGCIEPRSICILQDGIAFLSSAGLYMLTNALEVVYIGHNVEDEISAATFRDMTSAILLDDEAQQRFAIRFNGVAGETLVYDDVQKAWSLFAYTNGTSAEDNVSAVRWVPPGATTPTYVFTDGGSVYQENTALYTDNGGWVPLTVTSAWIRSQNVQGFVMFWKALFFGSASTPHDLDDELRVQLRRPLSARPTPGAGLRSRPSLTERASKCR